MSLSVSFMLMSTDIAAQNTAIKQIEWTTAAELQNENGGASLGFAGPINAVLNDVFIVAGGANFPDKMPWEGGAKYYSKEFHVLQKSRGHFQWNKNGKLELPEAIAYCGNTVTKRGLVYAGGENESGLYRKAYLVNWDTTENKASFEKLADLPSAVTNVSLTHIDNIVYAVGGDENTTSTKAFLSLDLDSKSPQWIRLPDLPIALANAVVVTQQLQGNTEIYVIGGRSKNLSGISELRNTVLIYSPINKTWKAGAAISDGDQTTNYSAGAGIAIGDNEILLLGGDNGETFHKIETYISQISKSASTQEKEKLTVEKNALSINHKGFYRGMLIYNTETNKWIKMGELPFLTPVTTSARIWDGKIVLSNGEIKPGLRTPKVMLGSIK